MYSKLFIFTLCLFFGVCAVEKHAVVQTPKIQTTSNNTKNIKMLVSIGIFDNSSNFLKGVFSNGEDRISNQAKTILTANLKQVGIFQFYTTRIYPPYNKKVNFPKQTQISRV